jgi:hypothetical protein
MYFLVQEQIINLEFRCKTNCLTGSHHLLETRVTLPGGSSQNVERLQILIREGLAAVINK